MSKNIPQSDKYYVRNALVNYYLLLMLAVFPLFFTNKFISIRHDKYWFFIILSGVFVLASAISLLFGREELKRFISLSFTDIAFAVLLLCFTASTLLSDYPLDSFTGEQGRNSGLLLFIVFFAVYAFVSRNFIFKSYVFMAFAVSCILVCALCIVNRLGGDPLGMYKDMPSYVSEDFVSTIGNRNMMSCFCCLTAPFFAVMFINTKAALRFLYLAAAVSAAAAMIFCDSMSGLLGLVPTGVIIALFYLRASDKQYTNKLFWILLSLSLAVIAAFAALFVYFTFFDTQTKLGGFMKFFRFNYRWGTHRGYIWKKSFAVFGRFSLKDKLLGCGPDTFYNAFEPYFAELERRFGDASSNAAHNEYLNYLITTGALGLASYLALMGSVVVRAFKTAKREPLALAFAASVVCYLIQSTVNIATPITTPILFIFAAICENYSRKLSL